MGISSYNPIMITRNPKRLAWLAIGLLLLALLSIFALKAFRIYSIGQRTYADIQRLQNLPRANLSDPNTLHEFGNSLARVQTDLELTRAELRPFFPITKTLTWLPRFSTEVVYMEELFDAGSALLETGRTSLNAAEPALELISENSSGSLLDQVPELIETSTAPIHTAAAAFERYQIARAKIPVDQLDPVTRQAFAQLDSLTPQLANVFQGYSEIPALIGLSTSNDALTSFNTTLDNRDGASYLLIFQNEDELRATGGFVTAIGTLTLTDGKPSLGKFTDSPEQDDLSKIYPPPPWWLKQYMRADYLLLRDANWEIDFPQAALSMAQLYGYYDPTPLSGVISLDQQAIVRLLRFTGPIQVAGFDQPVSADNLIYQLRAAKSIDATAFGGVSGERKAFLEPIAHALMARLLQMMDMEHAKDLVTTLSAILDEKHMLISLFTPGAQSFLADRGWNGAVSAAPNMDTLMIVDSNIGFNKTNALVTRSYKYEVDLTNLAEPKAELVVSHSHNGDSEVPCQQWGAENPQSVREYPMERCYYNYLRVVTPAGNQLLNSQTHPVSGLIIGGTIPERVDELNDRVFGARVWGTLMALPGYKSLTNSFSFSLPADVVSRMDKGVRMDGNLGGEENPPQALTGYAKSYTLKLLKQPGTPAEAVSLVVHLPAGARLFSSQTPASAMIETLDGADGDVVQITFSLNHDELITLMFE